MDLLKSINNIKLNVLYHDLNIIIYSKFKKEFYVIESKHPYMTEQSKR